MKLISLIRERLVEDSHLSVIYLKLKIGRDPNCTTNGPFWQLTGNLKILYFALNLNKRI
jgi:hypothetical protein